MGSELFSQLGQCRGLGRSGKVDFGQLLRLLTSAPLSCRFTNELRKSSHFFVEIVGSVPVEGSVFFSLPRSLTAADDSLCPLAPPLTRIGAAV